MLSSIAVNFSVISLLSLISPILAGETKFCHTGYIEKTCFRNWPTDGVTCPGHPLSGKPDGFIPADKLADGVSNSTPPCTKTPTFKIFDCDIVLQKVVGDNQLEEYGHLHAFKTFDDDGNPVYSYDRVYWNGVSLVEEKRWSDTADECSAKRRESVFQALTNHQASKRHPSASSSTLNREKKNFDLASILSGSLSSISI